jgi:hypothetical protein
VGEINQFDDAVHHGAAQGDQGIDAAEKQGVDRLLEKKSTQIHFGKTPKQWTGRKITRSIFYILQILTGQRIPVGDKIIVFDNPDDMSQFAVTSIIKFNVAGYTLPGGIPDYLLQGIGLGGAGLSNR